MSNLPQTKPVNRSDQSVRQFFDQYFTKKIEFPANQVDAVVGFFKNRGFDNTAAISTSIVLLEQAKLDNINIFALLDTLNGKTNIQLSQIVTEILNYKRPKCSSLGFRQTDLSNTLEQRNIAP